MMGHIIKPNSRTTTMKSIGLLFFLVVLTQSILAQYTINGRIADENDSGVPFANVLLLNISDSILVKGAVSDQNGNYQLSNVSSGKYLIQSYMVGFAKSYSSEIYFNAGKTLTIADIILMESTKELEEVVIKAEKPLYEQTIDMPCGTCRGAGLPIAFHFFQKEMEY